MFDYVDEIINAFDKAEPKGGGTKSNAAPDHLFKVDKDREKLTPEQAVEFHNLVAKTLYATKRARPDTCTAIAFLMTRVRAPNKDDWNKVTHLPDPLCQRNRHFEVVGGCSIRSPSQHVRT
jgi:hypothetical protein